MQTSFVSIIITILVVGTLLWAINEYWPLQPQVKKILNAVVIIALIIWLLIAFGLLHYVFNLHT